MPLNNQPNEGYKTPDTSRRHTEHTLRLRNSPNRTRTANNSDDSCSKWQRPESLRDIPLIPIPNLKSTASSTTDNSSSEETDSSSDHSIIRMTDGNKKGPSLNSTPLSQKKKHGIVTTIARQCTLHNAKITVLSSALAGWFLIAAYVCRLTFLIHSHFPEKNDTEEDQAFKEGYRSVATEERETNIRMLGMLLTTIAAALYLNYKYSKYQTSDIKETNEENDDAEEDNTTSTLVAGISLAKELGASAGIL